MPDDFAGMFPPDVFKEFVAPYWSRMYTGLQATQRVLHSELLRPEHLDVLKALQIEYYDPGANQYLTPECLRDRSTCPFQANIQSWHIHDSPILILDAMYRRLAACRPARICFCMNRLDEEPKIRHLLNLARTLETEV